MWQFDLDLLLLDLKIDRENDLKVDRENDLKIDREVYIYSLGATTVPILVTIKYQKF